MKGASGRQIPLQRLKMQNERCAGRARYGNNNFCFYCGIRQVLIVGARVITVDPVSREQKGAKAQTKRAGQ